MSLHQTAKNLESDLLHIELLALLEELINLEKNIDRNAQKYLDKYLPFFERRKPDHSATNLAHYLNIRHTDLRPLQKRLAQVELSLLGRSESNVSYSLNSIIELLARVTHSTLNKIFHSKIFPPLTPEKSHELLIQCRTQLFGPLPANRNTYIMVTLPSEAAWNGQLIESLMSKGMNCRLEFTDAAMAGRAECVRLNKGPYIEGAMKTPDNIIIRMEAHQYNKRT